VSAPRIVLASASPTRVAILARAGLPVTADPAGIDEAEIKARFRQEGATAAACAEALAEAKAMRVAARHSGALVIGADQMLDCGGTWLDKPRDLAEARRQLALLRGQTHELPTAVTVVCDGVRLWQMLDRPRLVMRDFSDHFLGDYIVAAGEEILDAVGAYQIEGRGAQLFQRIEGDFFSILGLPLLPLLAFLRSHGAVTA